MRLRNVIIESTTDPDVGYSLRRVSLESAILQNTVKLLTDVLPDFITNLTGKKESLANVSQARVNVLKHLEVTDKQLSLINQITGTGYLNYADKLVVVPEDFKGNLKQYVELVQHELLINYTLLNALLEEFTLIVSSFVTNDFSRVSLKDYNELSYKSKNFLEEYRELRKEYFEKHTNGKSVAKLSSVVSSSTELELMLVSYNRLVRDIKTIDIKGIETKVDTLIDLLNLTLKSVKGVDAKVSGNMTRTLSEGSYNIAKSVESFTAFYFDAYTLINAIEELVKRVEK